MIKEMIKVKRKESGMTQEILAEKLHVSRTTVSSWETGRTYPDLNMVVEMSDIFDVSLDYLLKGDGNVVNKISKDSKKGRVYTKILIGIIICMLLVGLYFVFLRIKVDNLYSNIIDEKWTENKFDYSMAEDSIEYKVNKIKTYNIFKVPQKVALSAEAKYTTGENSYINGVSIIDYKGNKNRFLMSWSERDLIGQKIYMDSTFKFNKNIQDVEKQTLSYEFEKNFNKELEIERPYMKDFLYVVDKKWHEINK